MKSYLRNIIDDFPYENLSAKWQDFNFGKFSSNKTLFDFQKDSLRDALKALHLFYVEYKGEKKPFYTHYQNNGLTENFDYDLKKKTESKTAKYLLDYDKDYSVIDDKISFAHFINRMSFWMATGSGKTLVIVKLIELLGRLIQRKEIPQNDILFLTHKEDLLDQFKDHIKEFNSYNSGTKINLINLKDYDNKKRENALVVSEKEITVFYYRSDLISDEHKEKIVNFKNYDNSGKWYILLDEAHKGDKEDSKRQILYSILSRNGFLFNFSATFTDPRDYITCVFNFNLSKFIEEGYGKHIYISGSEMTAFHDRDDFSNIEKQKIVLKTLILQTYINKCFDKVRKEDKTLYHRPLLLTLVNSVDTKDADLKMFFSELEKVAKDGINNELLKRAKGELIEEFENKLYEFENIKVLIDKELIKEIEYKDILQHVFNSKSSGRIEVLKIPGNRNEIIFKLQTSEMPFGLIKIGDISGWLKEKLEGYEIIESFDNESIFKKINRDDSEINILMGSRSFYEGWDSNRPNIILFVNIGVGSEAKKFVLQSVGRGVRIEPQKNKRKRILDLFNAKEISEKLFNKVKQNILPLESLFVFGTNAENLKEIIKALKEEKQDVDLGTEFIINKEAEKRLLLIPVYKESDKIYAEEKEIQKYVISKEDFELAKSKFEYIGDKVILVKHDCNVRVMTKIKKSFETPNEYYIFSEERSISDADILINRIINHFNLRDQELERFKKLEKEIIHFKRIRVIDSEKGNLNYIKEKIEVIKKYPEALNELMKQYGKIPRKEYEKKQSDLYEAQSINCGNKRLGLKYIQNHYYIPLIISEDEKIDYISHIVNVKSEVEFIKELENYIEEENNIFKKFDWWMFSKLDQTLDEVYIPYYNSKEFNIARFKPDFIFWMQKDKEYTILLVDPKGTEHADAYRKIDGYSRIFEDKSSRKSKTYSFNGFNIKTKLLFKSKLGVVDVPEKYRNYWFDNFDDFAKKIND